MMTIQRILELAKGKKIAVIGDLIIDRYVNGEVNRISPEAPIPVMSNIVTTERLGGAGNVLMNLENLGVEAYLYCIHAKPMTLRIHSDNIYAHIGTHSIKTRFVHKNHQLLRVDDELPYEVLEWYTFKQFNWWAHLQEFFNTYDCIVFA